MSATHLQQALECWAQQDDIGGFRAVAQLLFPAWEPRRSCHAPHREDKTPSFSVYRNGGGDWRFKDQATGEQGGLVGFVMLAEMDQATAARWLMDKAGIVRVLQPIDYTRRPRPECRMESLGPLPAMPAAAMEAWGEGVDYLMANTARIDALAEFRGWPLEFARYLADCACISMPLYHGQRTIAFLVTAPEPGVNALGGRIIMRDIGFHCRLKPRPGETKASWRFVPNESEHKQSTPALPFLISGSAFDATRLLIVTEGQWDGLSFALAAGWLGDDCLWPEAVSVVGIRGASGANTFLRWYERFWPKQASCLLVADADQAGGSWSEGEHCFAKQLAKRCTKVAVVDCYPHKDFNDLYRAERPGREVINELLVSHGMAVESEVLA